MECYLSFSNEDVFRGIALPEETPIIPPEEVTPQRTQPKNQPAPPWRKPPRTQPWSLLQRRGLQTSSLAGEKVLYPSRPTVTARETPPLSRGTKWRPNGQSSGGGLVWQPQTKEPGVSTTQSEPPSQTSKSEVIWWVTLPPGFTRVTACLQRDQSPEGVCKVPLDPLMIEVISTAAVATNEHKPYHERQGDRGHLHGHCDHLSGIGDPQWPQTGDLSPGAHNTRCNRPHLRSSQITAFGQ